MDYRNHASEMSLADRPEAFLRITDEVFVVNKYKSDDGVKL
jgi:hypothetical protein